MIYVHGIDSLRQTFEARASEWVLSWIAINLSLVFFFNPTIFELSLMSGLRSIIDSRLTWGVLFLSIGTSRLIMLLINGSYWRTPHFRALFSFLSAGLWFVMVMGFYENRALVLAVMLPLMVQDLYNAKRSSREAGVSEFLQRQRKKKGRKNAEEPVGTA